MSHTFDLWGRNPIDHDFSGETLGQRYKLVRRIGVGGMSSIYAATVLTTKATVAVKVLHPEHDQDPDITRRFVQEGQLAAQVRHPCLVPAYDLGWLGGRRFIVLELVEGRSITTQIAEGALPWERTVPIMLDLLAALAALHARGVAHRDISPNNCMIESGTERGRLLDLGYARLIEEDTGLVLTPPDTSTSMMIWGSEGYIAPERFRGRPGDYRADVFSIGALWAAMLGGERLPDPHYTDPASVAQRIPLPAPLRAVLVSALDVRDRRHHSAASMAEALRIATREVARQRQTRRAVWFAAPALGLLALPAWLALRFSADPCTCPLAAAESAPVAEDVSPAPAAAASVATVPRAPDPPPAAPNADDISDTHAAAPPAPGSQPATPTSDDIPVKAPARHRPSRRAPFDLGTALAACKPHPTTRLVITYDPERPLQINDEPPQGEMGLCVEEVLASHPPQRVMILRP